MSLKIVFAATDANTVAFARQLDEQMRCSVEDPCVWRGHPPAVSITPFLGEDTAGSRLWEVMQEIAKLRDRGDLPQAIDCEIQKVVLSDREPALRSRKRGLSRGLGQVLRLLAQSDLPYHDHAIEPVDICLGHSLDVRLCELALAHAEMLRVPATTRLGAICLYEAHPGVPWQDLDRIVLDEHHPEASRVA